MKICFMLIGLFLLTLLQILFGNFALAVPFALMGAVYFTVAYGWRYGAFGVFLTGSVLAAFYDTASLVPAVWIAVPAAVWWHQGHEDEPGLIGWQPGMFLVLGNLLALQAARLASGGGVPQTLAGWLFMVLQLVSCLILTLCLFPLVVLLGDAAAEWFGLPRFRAAGGAGGRSR